MRIKKSKATAGAGWDGLLETLDDETRVAVETVQVAYEVGQEASIPLRQLLLAQEGHTKMLRGLTRKERRAAGLGRRAWKAVGMKMNQHALDVMLGREAVLTADDKLLRAFAELTIGEINSLDAFVKLFAK
jgi:hypothetical protein